jgi:phospholipid-binding lipoprotein MlaA
MWVKEAGVVIRSRLLAFSLLGFVMILGTGCAGRVGTAQPRGLNDAKSVAEQNPFAGANEPDPRVDPFAGANEYDPLPVADQTRASAPSSPPETQSDEPLDPFARADEGAGEEYDPWEPMNTNIFEFNRQVDRFVLKPVAKGYNFVMPDLVQVGISNIFSNLRFAPRFLNNVFQGKLKGAGIEVGRFLINSTAGLGGFFDVAKHVDLVTSDEDMGQTLGFYGVRPGPYLVLPFLPPFTVRDFVGYVGDVFLNPINWLVVPIIEVNHVPSVIAHKNRMTSSLIQTGSRVGEIVNERSRNLEKYQGVEEATLDLYTAVRNAYLQTRERAIRE